MIQVNNHWIDQSAKVLFFLQSTGIDKLFSVPGSSKHFQNLQLIQLQTWPQRAFLPVDRDGKQMAPVKMNLIVIHPV